MSEARVWAVGRSAEDREITVYSFERTGDPFERSGDAFDRGAARGGVVLILGAVHGDEPKSAFVARRLAEDLVSDTGMTLRRPCVILPVVNPDGYARRRRRNARGVDINRNFPAANWGGISKRSRMHGGPEPLSEPETRAVVEAMRVDRPRCVIAIHSIDRRRHCNNFDGPAEELARLFARYNGYPITSSIGYPTPGSFGTWAGVERGIPVLTLELPSHHSPKRCWLDNRPAFHALLTGADFDLPPDRDARRAPSA